VDKPYKCQIIQQIEIIVQKIMHFSYPLGKCKCQLF